MARNEEKQLAKLNRLYLQKQKEEELRKRPPRPKLETLTSVDDIKKWLPTIIRDIDFYVKQMEVPCYPKSQIEEFESCIDHLRRQYKAFIRKMHQLEPDLRTTPWSDRPYMGKRKKIEACEAHSQYSNDTIALEEGSGNKSVDQSDSTMLKSFIPLSTPVLKNDSLFQQWYGFEKPKVPQVNEAESEVQNEPLQFDFGKRKLGSVNWNAISKSVHSNDEDINYSHLEFNPQVNGRCQSCASDKKSIHFHVEHHKEETDLKNEETALNSKTSRLLHQNKVNAEYLEKCNSQVTKFHVGTESEKNSSSFSGGCKYTYGEITENTTAKDNGFQSQSKDDNSPEVSVLGALNIPYSDSSSDDET